MSYKVRCSSEDVISITSTAGSDKTAGQAGLVGGVQGFWLDAVSNGSNGVFVTRADRVLVDVDNTATYSAGDLVYEHATVPTGTLNKTATSRTCVGYAQKSYPANTSQIEIVFHGGNG